MRWERLAVFSLALVPLFARAQSGGLATLRTDLDTEISARQASDSALSSALDAENSARQAADASGAAARQQGDANTLAAAKSYTDTHVKPAAYQATRMVGDGRGEISVTNATFTTIARITVPPGSYVATASVFVRNDAPEAALPYCLLFVRASALGLNSQAMYSVVAPAGVATLPLTMADTVLSTGESGTGYIELSCTNNAGAAGDLKVLTYNVTAIQVGALTTTQP